jgi:hypothetical protein
MIRKTISEGAKLPRGYGVAWRPMEGREVVCYPVPVNVAMCFLRDVWWRLCMPGSHRDKVLGDAYYRGFETGYRIGFGKLSERVAAWSLTDPQGYSEDV